MEKQKIAVACAGFSGAVLARELALSGRFEVDVFETGPHIAGNRHTERDAKTGVMLHQYGPHFFNTSPEDVWSDIQQFGEFGPNINRVIAVTILLLFI